MLVQLDDTSALEDSITSLPSVSSLNSHHFIPRLRAESSNGSSVVISSPSSGTHSPKWDNDSVFAGPISPISLAADSISSSNRNRERSFSTPLEPHNAKYITELSYVRSEAAPRLRHAVRAVDTEWTQVLNNKAIPSRDLKEKFENWWANKKCYTMTLEEKAKRLGDAAGIRANGLGWTAP